MQPIHTPGTRKKSINLQLIQIWINCTSFPSAETHSASISECGNASSDFTRLHAINSIQIWINCTSFPSAGTLEMLILKCGNASRINFSVLKRTQNHFQSTETNRVPIPTCNQLQLIAFELIARRFRVLDRIKTHFQSAGWHAMSISKCSNALQDLTTHPKWSDSQSRNSISFS